MDKYMTGSMLYDLAGTPRWKYVFWSPQAYHTHYKKTQRTKIIQSTALPGIKYHFTLDVLPPTYVL